MARVLSVHIRGNLLVDAFVCVRIFCVHGCTDCALILDVGLCSMYILSMQMRRYAYMRRYMDMRCVCEYSYICTCMSVYTHFYFPSK